MENIKNILKKLPKTPGIYQFFNSDGKIIYIGKSVNLFSRVNSYFNGKSKLNFAKQKMVEAIFDIKIILTNNETESLILETTLIKKHEPKYNILMKDGKNHIYIKITTEFIPSIIKTRFKGATGTYFGPYTSTNYVNNILKLSKKIFGYRSCDLHFKKEKNGEIIIDNIGNTKIPCMDYYIKRCSGPCLKENSKIIEYKEKIEQISHFLKGNTSKIKLELESEMRKKASELKFEEAGKLKQDIESLKTLEENQIVRDGINGDFNIVNFIAKFEKFYIGMIEIRDSKITGFYNFEIKNNLEEEKEILLKTFIENDFAKNIEEKNTYIIPFQIDFEIDTIKTEVPKIGNKKELLDLCYKNIYEYAYKSHLDSLSTKGFSKQTMINLLQVLGYEQINKDIIFECNDISHISGNHTVASRSIIENGKSNTSKYKKYRIKTLEEQKINDFDSMREVMTRRLKEIEKSKILPDMIIIDGGKGQLSSVVEVINKFKSELNDTEILLLIEKLQIVSIAKREEELFIINSSKEFERILLDKESNELKLVQKIRDEAHRFAITFNRDSRIKAMKKNILESLPGFGPKTRTKLLKKYGNVEALKLVDIEELKEILNKSQIETLENHSII
ncbi:MAG: excinuclease ABC subunit UvrC [Candidatus Gracilibacteria bacterium]|nr:excinuclease ABC subunit UvrC [Candidatus Gracilibacteria bacterium]